MKELTDLRMSGSSPFNSYGDVVNSALCQARAILILIEAGHRAESDLDRLPGGQDVEVFRTLNPTIMADAIDGVEALIALAQYCRDMETASRAPAARAVAA